MMVVWTSKRTAVAGCLDSLRNGDQVREAGKRTPLVEDLRADANQLHRNRRLCTLAVEAGVTQMPRGQPAFGSSASRVDRNWSREWRKRSTVMARSTKNRSSCNAMIYFMSAGDTEAKGQGDLKRDYMA